MRLAHRPLSLALAAVLPLAVGAAFWIPAVPAARGFFPAPLDDVYIHYDFARSLAEGHPFEWIPGNGYSSGETSPLYAVMLAIGWLVGFRGKLVGVFGAAMAILALAALMRSVMELARAPRHVAWLAAAVPLSIPLVDWALFSGMEVAAFAGALGCALVALHRTREGRMTREHAQWRLGFWGAALVLLRPEAVVLVGVFAIVAARGARARSGIAAVMRASVPGAMAVSLLLGANVLATGDAASAGARLKLLSSNPYLSEIDRAKAFVENLVTFAIRGIGMDVSLLVLLLAAVGLFSKRTRAVASACLLGALAWTLLVSWNGNSPHHNFRYYAPAILLVAIGASLGVAAVARWRKWAAAALALSAIALGASRFPAQTSHFARAVANVRDQQIEVGVRLAAKTPPGSRVLLGDAGAIPFVSNRDAVDALGLGGYKRMPFARAAVHGEAATIELIERLEPADRPTHLALYPNWFGALTGRFGVEIDRVTIVDNLICGGATKAIYRADWSPLDLPSTPRDDIDEIDVADIVSEADHAYAPPVPRGGWTTLDILSDAQNARRFDGGRVIPAGASESFVVRRASGPSFVRVRTDASANAIVVRVGTIERTMDLPPARDGAWREATSSLDLHAGDIVTLTADGAEYRDYHVWIEPASTDRAATRD